MFSVIVERIEAVVVGAGQAGLATSHELKAADVHHVVLERARVAEAWRRRWDSFCFVTPNWTARLPGIVYDGDDPDGFMSRDEIVLYLERYAASFDAPVRLGVEVTSLEATSRGGFLLRSSSGDIATRSVVVATGAYQRPHRPEASATIPASLLQMDVNDYRNPNLLPPGAVLVVGSGQSGCQIAEELLGAGREVFLSCGRAPWAPRRWAGHDLYWWAMETGYMDERLADLDQEERLLSNPQATGSGGGHDLHYRTIRQTGVTLLGHFLGAEVGRLRFADDLADSVAWGDQRYAHFMSMIRRVATERRIVMPAIPDPPLFESTAPTSIDLGGLGAVVWATGFRPDYGTWLRVPGALDDRGFPIQFDGASTVAPGLFFVGVRFLRTRKSSLVCGAGEDAVIVGHRLVELGKAYSSETH
jgi:putative flavoprotein involved in K+ transport